MTYRRELIRLALFACGFGLAGLATTGLGTAYASSSQLKGLSSWFILQCR